MSSSVRDENVCCDAQLKLTFISRFLLIICKVINLIFNQIVILCVCLTIYGEDRGARSARNRKQFTTLKF